MDIVDPSDVSKLTYMSRRLTTALLSLALVTSVPASADDEDHEFMFRNAISAGPSVAKAISGGGEESSGFGVDYLYRISPHWEIGAQFDLNYGEFFDNLKGYSVVPIISYSVTERFPIFLGAGVEHRRDTNENELILRAGFEYSIPLDDGGKWVLLPGGFLDYIDDDYSVSIVVAVGYNF